MIRGSQFVVGCGVAVVVACSGDETAAPVTTPYAIANSILIVSGAELSDTVQADLGQALSVRVVSADGPRTGIPVRFSTIPLPLPKDSSRRTEAMVLLSAPASGVGYGSTAIAVTDGAGVARVALRLGTLAGNALVVATVPEAGISDTANIAVTQGAPLRYVKGVRDTVIAPGSAYVPGFGMADRYGNIGTRGLTAATELVNASVDASGVVHAGTSYGRGQIVFTTGTTRDTARFTVLDGARMSVVVDPSFYGRAVATVGLNGSDPVYLVRSTGSSSQQMFPSIAPLGDRVVFQTPVGEGSAYKLYVSDVVGTRRQLLDTLQWVTAENARFSGDGQFIFFGGRRVGDEGAAVWRVRSDGTGLTRIAPMSLLAGFSSAPVFSPSPDGLKVAYLEASMVNVIGTAPGSQPLRITATQVATDPAFSPDGTRIAFRRSGRIVVMRADGTEITTVGSTVVGAPSGANPPAPGGLTWTRDGRWVLTRARDGLLLVSSTGPEEIPVPNSGAFFQPTLAQR